MRIALLLAALLLGTLTGGCGADPDSPGAVDLSAADNGGTVGATTGEQVVLTLESNASTGYSWRLADEPDQDVLAFVSSEYVAPQDGDLVGAAGAEVWTWNAVGEGSTVLRLEYVRPFEPDEVAETFEVTIEVG